MARLLMTSSDYWKKGACIRERGCPARTVTSRYRNGRYFLR